MTNAKATRRTRREQSLPQRAREFEEEMLDRHASTFQTSRTSITHPLHVERVRARRSNREAMIAHTIEHQRDTFNGYEYRIL